MGNLIFAIVYTVVSLFVGGWVGTMFLLTFMAGLLVTVSGGTLEISMSIDNAVVNSSILRGMSPFWRKNYLLFGMPIAVVGMRFLIPDLVVSATSAMNPWDTLMMAIHNPSEYSTKLLESKPFIQAFGITFLTLIVGDFFINSEKDSHWFSFVEKPLSALGGKLTRYTIAFAVLAISAVIYHTTGSSIYDVGKFIVSGLIGVLSFYVIKSVADWAQNSSDGSSVSSGFAQFLMLEAIDASFSFDGVIGAFAITQNIFLIAIALGIGAVWVRYLTVLMADSKSIGELKYLSHGAFWNIASLIAIMVVSIAYEVPEWFPGAAAILIIGASVTHSLLAKD